MHILTIICWGNHKLLQNKAQAVFASIKSCLQNEIKACCRRLLHWDKNLQPDLICPIICKKLSNFLFEMQRRPELNYYLDV